MIEDSKKVVDLQSQRQRRWTPTPLSVLVVEDDDIDARLIDLALNKSVWFKVDVTRARGLEEAKNFLPVANFDIVLLDYWLGPDSGLQLLDDLGGRHSELPVVLLTGYSDLDFQRLGHSAGAVSFLSKDDISPNALDSVIRSTLHTHHLETELLASIERRDAAVRQKFEAINSTGGRLDKSLQQLDETAESMLELGLEGRSEQFLQQADIIQSIIRTLRKTARELLDQMRAENQHFELSLEVLDLRDLISKSIRLSAGQVAARSQTIAYSEPDSAFIVKADRTALLQALLHLISNACKYSGTESEIAMSLDIDEDMAVILIEDSGIGMSKADIERAIGPFAADGPKGAQSGADVSDGLGLPITSSIMRQHGGWIGIESKPGTGTKVRLALPLEG